MSCGVGGFSTRRRAWRERGERAKTDLFETASKDQVSLGRQVPFIARAEPPAAVPTGPEALPVGLFIVDVPEHDVAPADTHFPALALDELSSVLGRADRQFNALRFADGARVSGSVVREGRAAHGVRGFAHGVRLEHGGLECFFESRKDGRAEAAAA